MNKLRTTISVLIILMLAIQIIAVAETATSDQPAPDVTPTKQLSKEELFKIRQNNAEQQKILRSNNKSNPKSILTSEISSIPLEIKYTNPITGISIFGTVPQGREVTFWDALWYNYSFYLPIASYVNIDYNTYIHGYVDYGITGLTYEMNLDNDEGYLWLGSTYGKCNPDSIGYCAMDIHMSKSTYLTKGWHNIFINGYAYPSNEEFDYFVNGKSLTIIAFPEYTAITVTSPNGGETWYRGQTKTITWSKAGNPGANVKIELYKNNTLSSVITSKTANDGSYSWYIPTYTPTGTNYKIKITGYEEPKYIDWSNNNFRIS